MAPDADTFRLLFDASPRPMWMFDRETRRFLAVNDPAVAMYGWSREELLAMRLDDVRPPEERAALLAGPAAPKETLAFGRRATIWTKAGDRRELHIEVRCIERDGRELGFAMATDHTGVAEVDRRFRLLVEHSGEAIALTDERGRVEYLSPAGERIFGCPASEIIGTIPTERVHPDDARAWQTPAPSRTLVQHVRLRHSDGSWRWVECSMTNLMVDPDVRGFVSNFRDVSERRETLAAIERSEANFRVLIERSPLATFVHRDGRHVYVNPAAAALLGYDSPDDLVGRTVLEFIHPDDRALVQGRVQRTVEVGEAPVGEARMLRRDGSTIVVEAYGVRLDVTERRELVARMALADRMLTVGALAAGVAHEINNPLAYIATNLEILAREAPPSLAGLVADAREGVERVSAIVRDLRELARPEDDGRGPVDVVAVLASSIKMAHNEIRVRATSHDSEVIVEIEDTGAGIPASIIKRIFDPFFTTKAPGVGMGLGLTISHQIVRAMDGQITVSSRPGSGTTFTVTLPVAPAARDAARDDALADPRDRRRTCRRPLAVRAALARARRDRRDARARGARAVARRPRLRRHPLRPDDARGLGHRSLSPAVARASREGHLHDRRRVHAAGARVPRPQRLPAPREAVPRARARRRDREGHSDSRYATRSAT
jgi:PAS domain S-box-containing protein